MRRILDNLRGILSKRPNAIAALLILSLAVWGSHRILERSHRLTAGDILDSVVVLQHSNGVLVGSGVILEGGRYVLTVDHVVEGVLRSSGPVVVRYRDGREDVAKIIKRNKHFDIALLQIPYSGRKGLSLVSDTKVHQGDSVRAYGHPYGITWMVSEGIVSRKSYFPPDIDGNKFVIWSTAWIEGGNSGGPLVNERGEIVGLSMAFINPRGVILGAQHLNLFVSGSEIIRFLEN